MIRFEILLPLYYNDGSRIEPEKFIETDDELLAHFDAISSDSVIVRGQWMYESTRYDDQLIRVRLDIDDSEENWNAMREIKETLKSRFDQLDIWITAHRIEIL